MRRVWKQIRCIRQFGIKLFIWNLFLKIFDEKIADSDKVYRILWKKHEMIIKYLEYYTTQYKEPVTLGEVEEQEEFVIWTMWWQGETDAPECIRLCINSIRANADGHRVVVITKDNYWEYVDIPQYIMVKFQQGKISRTHLSDIIRMNLLYNYGGFWIDGGVLVTKKIERFTYDYYTLRLPQQRYFCISERRWIGSVCGGKKQYEFFYYMKEMFNLYWKTEDELIDYCLIDYFTYIFLMQNDLFRTDMNRLPIKKYRVNDMLEYMNYEMEESFIEGGLNEETGYFRISWRNKMKRFIKGKFTLYGYFCNKYGVESNETD